MYPEICMLELNLLSAGNASLDVLAHVFQSCLKIISQKERNASVLIEQVKTLLKKRQQLSSFISYFLQFYSIRIPNSDLGSVLTCYGI